jgi:hypothetical protein
MKYPWSDSTNRPRFAGQRAERSRRSVHSAELAPDRAPLNLVPDAQENEEADGRSEPPARILSPRPDHGDADREGGRRKVEEPIRAPDSREDRQGHDRQKSCTQEGRRRRPVDAPLEPCEQERRPEAEDAQDSGRASPEEKQGNPRELAEALDGAEALARGRIPAEKDPEDRPAP